MIPDFDVQPRTTIVINEIIPLDNASDNAAWARTTNKRNNISLQKSANAVQYRKGVRE